MLYAIMIKGKDGDRFLAAEKNGAVSVTEIADDSVKGVEAAYNRSHRQGYEASMSACVHNIFFQPVIIEIPNSTEELSKLLDMDAGLHKLHTIAGSYYGWKIKPECVAGLETNMTKPRLISEEP